MRAARLCALSGPLPTHRGPVGIANGRDAGTCGFGGVTAKRSRRSACPGGVIVVKDFRGRHEAKPALVTDDMAAAVRGAELIVCPAPAHAQADIARLLAPHLTKGQVVFLPPRHLRLIRVRQGGA